MKTCLTFAIGNCERPLHLCYDSEDDAAKALREFARDIDSIPDAETVFVEGGRPDGRQTCVGFLKRDFLSIELDSFDDEEDDADESDAPIEGETTFVPHVREGAGLAVEAATKILNAAAEEA